MASSPRTFAFVTSNDGKWREAERLLSVFSGGSHKLERMTVDLPELQAATIAEVALEKARAAFAVVGRPVIIEDAGLELGALGGFPGPFIKYWESLGGLASICRAVDGTANRAAAAVCVLAVATGDRVWAVEGRSHGTIADRPRGTSGFGWDAIFVPEGGDRTWGESTSAEKDAVSHRRRAWEKLAADLAADPVV